VCLLGEGGMGSIYIARHSGLGRVVAIKTLRPELANRKDNVARFFQEAHTINALKHPNIVESLDLVEDVVDGAYCVLELLRGPDLKARLASGPLPIDSAVRIGMQLADALGKVHAIGVVHRDLKPENLILIERDGREDFVKLIDFGIAQIGHQGAGVFGTAAYMAPEQAASGATVDRRADVYSLGVILFEMVTGRHPFPSQTDSAYLIAHADTKVPRPSKLSSRCPPALEAVILRCMEKNPDARYASADQVAAALRVIDSRATSGGRAGVIAAGLVLAAGAGVAAFLVLPQYLENHIRMALGMGMHALTANKGPVVHALDELTELAEASGVRFFYEGTVMDGAPIFSLFRGALPAVEVLSIRGVLNSTTNLMLDRMEAGDTFDQAVAAAQAIGVAETDPSGDVDGWDAAIKIAALASVLMGNRLKPAEVDREGIRAIGPAEIAAAKTAGRRWKLVCTAERTADGIRAKVAPEQVGIESPMYGVTGTTSIVQFETDVLGRLSIVEEDPGKETTAYGLLADFIHAVG
jgi:homoserine dehydrogenase